MWSRAKKDLTGKRFTKLLVLREHGVSRSHKIQWECVCDCGNKTISETANLRAGLSKSCGKCIARSGREPKYVTREQKNAQRELKNKKLREFYRNNKTPIRVLNARMSCQIRSVLRGRKNQKSWRSLVGYSPSDLRKRVESQFVNGMNWDKFMKGEIHLDHIIPKSKFKFSTPDDIEFKRCWSLENLRPEWAHENMSRGDKILEPSQIPIGL